MTYDTKGIWRCYEIKVSVSDFRSKSKKTFCGHFNYFVMTKELYEKVKEEIPKEIGVYIGGCSVKRAKRKELSVDEQVLKDSMIRSLSREAQKAFQSKNPSFVDRMNRIVRNLEKERDRYRESYWNIKNKVYEKYGRSWDI